MSLTELLGLTDELVKAIENVAIAARFPAEPDWFVAWTKPTGLKDVDDPDTKYGKSSPSSNGGSPARAFIPKHRKQPSSRCRSEPGHLRPTAQTR